MDLEKLKALSDVADQAIEEANQKIDLRPRDRNQGQRYLYRINKPVPGKHQEGKPIDKHPCAACGEPTSNKQYCSRKCTLQQNSKHRKYGQMKESALIKREETFRRKAREKPVRTCEYRLCNKPLNNDKKISHQMRFCCVSCAAKERHAVKRDLEKQALENNGDVC